MPGIIVHTLLGTQVLDRWQRDASAAPFPASDAGLRSTFLSGCIGPDMGMFPGGALLFSDLAHYVRTGELTRALLQGARSDAERAYAWGWATHVLADAMIHPLINIAAGDARGCGPLTYADDPWLHLAVEVGVDGCVFDRWQKIALPNLPSLSVPVMDCIGGAFRAVYTPTFEDELVRDSASGFARWHRFGIAVAGTASANLYHRAAGRHGFYGFARCVTKMATGMFARQGKLHAITHPLAPSARAESLIDRALVEFHERFRELERNKLESLPNYNLDTGTIEQPDTYPLTIETLARLNAA